ncbi:MAG: hypothetical protein IPG67_02780 [Acidobacteria bacterium]|nr:hypothetical protein [Acidobacteriota bacterium]
MFFFSFELKYRSSHLYGFYVLMRKSAKTFQLFFKSSKKSYFDSAINSAAVTEASVAVTEDSVAVTETSVAVTENSAAVTEDSVAVTEVSAAATEVAAKAAEVAGKSFEGCDDVFKGISNIRCPRLKPEDRCYDIKKALAESPLDGIRLKPKQDNSANLRLKPEATDQTLYAYRGFAFLTYLSNHWTIS